MGAWNRRETVPHIEALDSVRFILGFKDIARYDGACFFPLEQCHPVQSSKCSPDDLVSNFNLFGYVLEELEKVDWPIAARSTWCPHQRFGFFEAVFGSFLERLKNWNSAFQSDFGVSANRVFPMSIGVCPLEFSFLLYCEVRTKKSIKLSQIGFEDLLLSVQFKPSVIWVAGLNFLLEKLVLLL